MGSVVVDDTITSVDAFRVSAVDSTGAGDAFNGALAVALAEGRSLVEAARWANAAACISVTRRGAQPSLPTRSEIEAKAVEMKKR
jgi:ribokinase